jgi:hypothetical protein
MARKIISFIVFDLNCDCKPVNLLQILPVAFPERMQLIFVLMLLVRKALVAVALDGEVVIQALDVSVTVRDDRSLAVQLSIQICVLLSPVVVKASLLVDICTEGLDEPDVAVHATLVVLVHPSLLFV